MTMLLAIQIIALVCGPSGPIFRTMPIFLVAYPIASVYLPIDVAVCTLPLSAVFHPLSLEHIAASSREFPMTMRPSVLELAFIHPTIRPMEDTLAMADIPLPLPFVSHTVLT